MKKQQFCTRKAKSMSENGPSYLVLDGTQLRKPTEHDPSEEQHD